MGAAHYVELAAWKNLIRDGMRTASLFAMASPVRRMESPSAISFCSSSITAATYPFRRLPSFARFQPVSRCDRSGLQPENGYDARETKDSHPRLLVEKYERVSTCPEAALPFVERPSLVEVCVHQMSYRIIKRVQIPDNSRIIRGLPWPFSVKN